MRKKIDKSLVEAIMRAIDTLGSQSELARRSGISQSTINSIINPKEPRQFVLDSVLEKLMPFISPYMAGSETILKSVENSGNLAVGSNNNFFAPGTRAVPGDIPPEVLQQTMSTMTPEEKARFLKELYSTGQKAEK